jgi:hypothetical protein
LKRVRNGIRCKCPDKWKNNWFLHHNNTPANTSLVGQQFLTFKNITVIPHPLIHLTSPPVTIFYSPRWKCSWKGAVFTWPSRSIQNRKRLSTHSHMRISRAAWNHGKQAGIVEYIVTIAHGVKRECSDT